MKMFIKCYEGDTWREVKGMHKSWGEWIPCLLDHGPEWRPVDTAICVNYCKNHDIEWRFEQ